MNAAFALPAVRPGAPPVDFAAARQQMLDCQIKPNNIVNPRVLEALATIPREIYVPADFQDRAYGDRSLTWEDGFLIEPTMCGLLVEHLTPAMPDHVLVVESGSGYVAALASRIFRQVTALFPDVGPAKVALNNYAKSGYDNVTAKSGLLQRGWSRSAPYQAIILSGASAAVPDAYAEQLVDDGQLIGFFPDENGLIKLRIFLKKYGVVSGRTLADSDVPYLPGLSPAPQFRF